MNLYMEEFLNNDPWVQMKCSYLVYYYLGTYTVQPITIHLEHFLHFFLIGLLITILSVLEKLIL